MLAAVLALLLSMPAGEGGVAAVLAEGARDPSMDAARLSERLTRLGPDALPELFAVLAHGPALGRGPSAVEEAAVLAALEACPRNALREHVRARLEAGADVDERRAFLRALARVATADELVLVRHAAGAEGAALAEAVEATAAGVLSRDAGALEPVRHWVLESPAEMEAPLVRGIGTSGSPGALTTLVDLLGYRSSLDHLIVPEIGRLLRDSDRPAQPELVAALAELLASDDPRLVREAALALGNGESFDATEELVELLGHEHAGVRDGAATALRRLTGLGFGASQPRWRAWYEAESRWLQGSGLELRQDLRAGSVEEVVHALGELVQHRFRRHELAVEIAPVLQHEDARVRKLACLALGRMGSRRVVPALQRTLQDRSTGVREAARVALIALGAEPTQEAREVEDFDE